MFEEFGSISLKIMMGDAGVGNKGFGFVSYEDPEDAEKACDASQRQGHRTERFVRRSGGRKRRPNAKWS